MNDCLNTVGVQYSKVSNIKGEGDVREFFVETNIPLISGASAMQAMSTNLAARWADYSGSGSVWAYKAGLDMQFTHEFRVRATWSQDVRAPNMSERFDKTGSSQVLYDPQFDETYNVTGFSGGNPNVAPEEAETLTAGFVYQPAWAEGLSMSIDWFDIEIDGAIGQLGHQAVVLQCEDGVQLACDLITRNPSDVEGVDISDNTVDSAFYMDLDLRYGFDLGDDLDLELFANMQNLTDQDPPVTPYYSVFFGYVEQANPLLFDVLGRRYTAGFRMSFQ